MYKYLDTNEEKGSWLMNSYKPNDDILTIFENHLKIEKITLNNYANAAI